MNLCLRVNLQYPFLHDFHFDPADSAVRGDDLTVDIGNGHRILIDQVKSSDTGPCQCLCHISANSPDTEYGHTGIF